jgi:hypothetical protein
VRSIANPHTAATPRRIKLPYKLLPPDPAATNNATTAATAAAVDKWGDTRSVLDEYSMCSRLAMY